MIKILTEPMHGKYGCLKRLTSLDYALVSASLVSSGSKAFDTLRAADSHPVHTSVLARGEGFLPGRWK